MKTLRFEVTITFEGGKPRFINDEIDEIAHNIMRGIRKHVNESGIVPDSDDSYTISINVQPFTDDYYR
jgi:hypothetical protein